MDEYQIFCVPMLVENILKNLAAADLLRMRRVCILWKTVCEDILSHRRKKMLVEVCQSPFRNSERDNLNLPEEWVNLIRSELRAWKDSWISVPSAIFIEHYLPGREELFSFPPKSKVIVIPQANISDPFGGVAVCGLPPSISLDYMTLACSPKRDQEEKFIKSLRREISEKVSKFVLVYVLNLETLDWLYFDLKRAISNQTLDHALICWTYGGLWFNPGDYRPYEECRAIVVSFKGQNVKATSVCHDHAQIPEELYSTLQRLSHNVSRLFPECQNHMQNVERKGRCSVCESVTLCFISSAGKDTNMAEFQSHHNAVSFDDIREAFIDSFPNVPLFCGTPFYAADAFTSNTVCSGYTTIFSVVVLS